MPFHASTGELRLALLSLFSAGPILIDAAACALVLDRSTDTASTAAQAAVGGDVENLTAVRLGAARVLNTLCAACRACPRGQGEDAEPVTLPVRRSWRPARRSGP